MPIDIYSPYYIQRAYGGYSPCVEGNSAHGLLPFAGSVLPNCVGLVVGRYNELQNLGACPYLGSVNANELLQYCASQGLPYSATTPVVGAVMVWDDGYEGHARIVEGVNSPTSIDYSESGWNYTSQPIVRYGTASIGNGNWGWNATFLGFIYPVNTPAPTDTHKMPIWMMLRYGL